MEGKYFLSVIETSLDNISKIKNKVILEIIFRFDDP
jgi:hypothetical protein